MTSQPVFFNEFMNPISDGNHEWIPVTPVQFVKEEIPEFRHKILDTHFCFNSENERGKVVMKCIVRTGPDGETCGRLLAVPKGIYSNLYKHMKLVHPTIPMTVRSNPNQHLSRVETLICPTQSSRLMKTGRTAPTTSKQQIFRHKILGPHFCLDSENEQGKAIMKCIVKIGSSGKTCGRLLAVPKGIYSNLFKHMKNVHPSISMPIRHNHQPNRGALISTAQTSSPISSESESYSNPGSACAQSSTTFVNQQHYAETTHTPVKNLHHISTSASASATSWPQQVFRHKILDPHFCFDSENDRGKVVMRCIVKTDSCGNTCGRLLAVPRGIYSNLYKHMKNVHPALPMSIQPNQDKLGKETLIFPNQTEQTSISAPAPSAAELHNSSSCPTDNAIARQLQFEKSVLDMFTVDGLQLDFLEKPGFLNMIAKLIPEVTVKSKQHYTRLLQEVVESEIYPALIEEFCRLHKRDFHFSVHVWPVQGWSNLVLEMKCHYINENWQKMQKAIKYSIIDEELCGEDLKEKFVEGLIVAGFNFGEIGLTIRDCPHERKTAFNMNRVFDDYYTFQMDHNDNVEEVDYEIADVHPTEHRDRDLSAEYFGFGELTCVAYSLQLIINASLKCDEDSKKFLESMNQIMLYFKKSPEWTNELKKLTEFGQEAFDTCTRKSRFDSLMIILEAFEKPGFGDAVDKVLQLARLDCDDSIGRDDISNQVPDLPLQSVKSTAAELHSILSPFHDAIHKLQSEVTSTSNLVILAIVSAFRRLLSIETDAFPGLKLFLLSKTKEKLTKILNSDEFVIAAILDPRQKLQIFTISWDSSTEKLEIPTRLDAISRLATCYEERELATPTSKQRVKRESISQISNSSMFDILNETSDPKTSEIDIYLNEPTCASDIEPLEYWKVNSNRFPILSLLAKRYLAIPATAGGTERIISMCSTITNVRAAKLTPREMEYTFLRKEVREPELIFELKKLKEEKMGN